MARLGADGGNQMDLILDDRLKIGIQTIHRRTEPSTGVWLPAIDELVSLVTLVDRCGYDSLWCGDHISFAVPILDPMLQLGKKPFSRQDRYFSRETVVGPPPNPR